MTHLKEYSVTKLVAVIYGSRSDWKTMQYCTDVLDDLKIDYHTQVVSAHRTPHLLYEFAQSCENNNYEVIIAGAGGAAHLPGMVASLTSLPVLGVPIQSQTLRGIDSLLSIAQMPKGIPVGTLAIGKAGASNAALLAAAILANKYPAIKEALKQYRHDQTNTVLNNLYR